MSKTKQRGKMRSIEDLDARKVVLAFKKTFEDENTIIDDEDLEELDEDLAADVKFMLRSR